MAGRRPSLLRGSWSADRLRKRSGLERPTAVTPALGVVHLPAAFAGAGRTRTRCLGARQVLDHALAGPLPLLQEDQEIGHLLAVRPLVELPDGVGAGLAGRGQDPKEIPPRRWSERVSEASRILPRHRGASVSAACPRRAAGSAPRPPRGRVGGTDLRRGCPPGRVLSRSKEAACSASRESCRWSLRPAPRTCSASADIWGVGAEDSLCEGPPGRSRLLHRQVSGRRTARSSAPVTR
jgi:hypothetical protein